MEFSAEASHIQDKNLTITILLDKSVRGIMYSLSGLVGVAEVRGVIGRVAGDGFQGRCTGGAT